MIENKRFFKSGLMLTMVGLSIRTVGMIFGAFISRTVGAEGTGLYTLVMTVYSFAVTFATSGISLTVTSLVASAIGEGRSERIIGVMRGAISYAFLFGLGATVGLFFGANLIGKYILLDLRTILALKVLSLSLIPSAMTSVFAGYFVGVKRVSFNATASVFCQAVKILVTVALVTYLAPRGIVSAVIGLCVGITLTELVGFFVIYLEYLFDTRRFALDKNSKNGEMKNISKMALPLAFSAYVRSFLLNIEHILIPKKLRESGESVTEAYSHYGSLHGMALPLVTYPMSPLSSFAGLLVPEFAEDLSAKRKSRMSKIASKAMNTTLAYGIISAIFLYSFSAELGYVIYKSYDAGYYISILSFIVPIMYLDHVTDSMLKGIGEQIFSMWVNISDSLLSVALVWILIPRMGILGYAVVILVMEAYNFALSFFRLSRRVSFKISPFSVILPLFASVFASKLSDLLFNFGGSGTSALWLTLKMLFALSITVCILALFSVKKKEILPQKMKTKKEKRQSF